MWNYSTAGAFLSLKFKLCRWENLCACEDVCVVKLWTSPWLVCPGIHIIISAVRADSINIRQSVFTTNTVQGLVALLTLGLDPNFDSIYKGSFHSLVMRCDSKLSDHPPSVCTWCSRYIWGIVFWIWSYHDLCSGVLIESFLFVLCFTSDMSFNL